MADYRDISQAYAQKGIQAAMILNGGAAIAVLSQVGALSLKAVAWPMVIWAIGTLISALCWVFAFISTRYVDKSEREVGREYDNLKKSDRFMLAGILALLISLLMFIAGCVWLALPHLDF